MATEFARGYVFGGFPWVPLGNSQVTVLPVAQLASVLGVYGLSALVAYVNAALAFALLDVSGRARIMAVGAATLVLIAVGAWGTWRIADGSLTARARRFASVWSGQHRAGGQVEPDARRGGSSRPTSP